MPSTKLLLESDGEFAGIVLRIGGITVMENAHYKTHPDGHEYDTISKVVVATDNGEEFECPKYIRDRIDKVLTESILTAQIFEKLKLNTGNRI